MGPPSWDTLCASRQTGFAPCCKHIPLCMTHTTLTGGQACSATLCVPALAPLKQTPLFPSSWQSFFVGGEAVNTESCPSCSAAGCDSQLQQEAAGPGCRSPGAGQTCCTKRRAGRYTHACPVPSQPEYVSADKNQAEIKFMAIHPRTHRLAVAPGALQQHPCCSSFPALPLLPRCLLTRRLLWGCQRNQCSPSHVTEPQLCGGFPVVTHSLSNLILPSATVPWERRGRDSGDPVLPGHRSSVVAHPCSIQLGSAVLAANKGTCCEERLGKSKGTSARVGLTGTAGGTRSWDLQAAKPCCSAPGGGSILPPPCLCPLGCVTPKGRELPNLPQQLETSKDLRVGTCPVGLCVVWVPRGAALAVGSLLHQSSPA